MRYLVREAAVQQDGARLARKSAALILNQYESGTVGYLKVAA